MQAGPLLVRLESQYTARIACRGDVVPVIVMLPIYLPAVTLAPMVGHYDLAPVPVRFDGVVFGQPVIEHENVLVRFHRHTPGIEKTCRLCLLPDPFITQLFKIGTAQYAGKRMLAEQQYGSSGGGNALYGIPHPPNIYHGIPAAVCRTVWRV